MSAKFCIAWIAAALWTSVAFAEDIPWKCTDYTQVPDTATDSQTCQVDCRTAVRTAPQAIEAETIFDSRWEYLFFLGGYDFCVKKGFLLIIR